MTECLCNAPSNIFLKIFKSVACKQLPYPPSALPSPHSTTALPSRNVDTEFLALTALFKLLSPCRRYCFNPINY